MNWQSTQSFAGRASSRVRVKVASEVAKRAGRAGRSARSRWRRQAHVQVLCEGGGSRDLGEPRDLAAELDFGRQCAAQARRSGREGLLVGGDDASAAAYSWRP
ncbi:MAG: hypothetical protein U1F11_03575 [Steroidobacteraceae bacterium]